MALTVSKFLQLQSGSSISMNRDRFVVKDFEEIDGRQEPVLINAETGDRLYGAIYVTHLMRLDGVEEIVEIPAAEEVFVEADSAIQDDAPTLQVDDAELDKLMTMSIEELGEPHQKDFFASEALTGRPDSPPVRSEDYDSLFKPPVD